MRRLAPILMTAAALALGGCADDSSDTTPDASGDFPVTIEHGQGTTEIPAKPKRVVTLSWTDTQIAQALDAPIVAAVRNPDSDDGNWPATSLDEEVLTLDSTMPNPEKIASYEPDLILMTAAQPTFEKEYERISQIAPTISYRIALLQDDGDDLTTMIGQALGTPDEAEQLIADSQEAIDAFRAELPGIEGVEVVFGQNYQGSTGMIVTDDSPVVTFFRRLGLVQPDELVGQAEDGDAQFGTVPLSDENLSQLDSADGAFINTPEGEDAFRSLPSVQHLRLTEDETIFCTDNEFAGMLLTPNPATTDVLLDRLREPLTRVAEARSE